MRELTDDERQYLTETQSLTRDEAGRDRARRLSMPFTGAAGAGGSEDDFLACDKCGGRGRPAQINSITVFFATASPIVISDTRAPSSQKRPADMRHCVGLWRRRDLCDIWTIPALDRLGQGR